MNKEYNPNPNMLEKSKYASDNKQSWTQSCYNLVWNTSSEQYYE